MRAARMIGTGGVCLGMALGTVVSSPGAATGQFKACDRVPLNKWTTTPTVDVLYYQGPCNPALVPGARAVVRVYINWKDWQGKKGKPDYYVSVQLTGDGQPVQCKVPPGARVRVLKQSEYADAQKAKAQNSINFIGCDLSGVSRLAAQVELFESQYTSESQPRTSQPRKVTHMSQAVKIKPHVVFPTVGSWHDGVPATAIHEATNKLTTGARFAEKNLPILEVDWKIDTTPVQILEPHLDPNVDLDWSEIDEEWSVSTSACPNYPDEKCRTFVEYDPLSDDELEPSDWLYQVLRPRYQEPLVVAVVPNDFQGGWSGLTKAYRSAAEDADDNTLEIKTRKPTVMILRMDMTIQTVAHELGHYLGLPHHEGTIVGGRTTEVEGFLASRTAGLNKSAAEGNGDPKAQGVLISLMAAGKPQPELGPHTHFIMNTQYKALQEDLEKNPIPPTAFLPTVTSITRLAMSDADPVGWGRARAVPWWISRGSASGASVLISGRIDEGGESASLAPVEWSPLAPSDGEGRGDWSLRFTDAPGAVLRSVPVDGQATLDSSHESPASTSWGFAVVTEVPEGAKRVELASPGGAVLATIDSPTQPAPRVRITSPGPGERWSPGTSIGWDVTGGDPGRPVSVYYSSDGGGTWSTLGLGPVGSALEPSGLPPGPDPMLIVAATDGFNVSADTVRFSVEAEVQPVGRTPSPGDTVPPGAEVRVTFNSELAPDAAAGARVLTDAVGEEVEGAISLSESGRAIHFVADQPLRQGEVYTVRIPEGLEDRYGNRSGSEHEWTFYVEPDLEGPRVAGGFPRDGALAIPLETSPWIWFSEDVEPGTLGGIRVEPESGGQVDGSVSWDDATQRATFDPEEPLAGSTRYRIHVPASVTDLANNGLEEPTVWSFTTAPDLAAAPGRPRTTAAEPPGPTPEPDGAAWTEVRIEGPNLLLAFPEDLGGNFRSSPQGVRGEASPNGLTARGGFQLGMNLSRQRTAGCGFNQSVQMGLQMLAGGRTIDGEIRLQAGPESVVATLEFDQGTITARAGPAQISTVDSGPGQVRVRVTGATLELRLDQGTFTCANLLDFGFALSEGG